MLAENILMNKLLIILNMRAITAFIYFILFYFSPTKTIWGQVDTACPKQDDKKLLELLDKGTDKKKYNKEQRMTYLRQALDIDADFTEANFAYAGELIKTAILKRETFQPAIPYFMKVIEQCPGFHSDPYYYVGENYYEDLDYKKAIIYLQKFINFKDEDTKKYSKDYDQFLIDANKMLNYAKFYINIMENPVPFDPEPVKGISTSRDEYLAAISPDNQYAYFIRKLPYTSKENAFSQESNSKETFMRSERQPDGSFNEGQPMPPPFNEADNQGAPAITIDDKHLYFTTCRREGGQQPNCDIYYSDFQDGQWGDIRNMGSPVNDPESWDSQPTISADGNTLYFVSDRPGGLGGYDIYKTVKDPQTNKWSSPENVGPPVNTSYDEKSPFLHEDSHTLYFSSDRPDISIGGYDIFYSRLDSAGKWEQPVNIGYPINSTKDDLGLFVSTDGKTAYFCSNDPERTGGKNLGGYDLYEFPLYKKARPQMVALFKGAITDSLGELLTGATVEVTNSKTHEKQAVMNDTVDASYVAVARMNGADNIVTVSRHGYAFNSGIVTQKDTFTGVPVKLDFKMTKISAGKNYILHDINFQTNSAELEPESKVVIKEFSVFLKNNPSIKIKIAGYTDNVGNDQDNLTLSSQRAQNVLKSLDNEGVSTNRMTCQGFGNTHPIANNDTEEGRKKNRRTEFIIVQK